MTVVGFSGINGRRDGAALVELLGLGAGQTAGGLAVFPLFLKTEGRVRYVTLAEAVAAGQALVTEVDEHGSVPELAIVNKGDDAILVLEGEEVRGAKQNRVLNTSILVPGHARLVIPVSCTEAGRWRYETPAFAPAEYVAERGVRRALRRSVSVALERGAGFRSDQGEVWQRVDELGRRHGVCSPTSAQRDTFLGRQQRLDRLVASFPLVDGQQGLLVVHGDEVVGFDVVSLPEKYALLHDRLLRSYALEALVSRRRACADPAPAKAFLDRLAVLEAECFPSPGLGTDLRFAGGGVLGSVLTCAEEPVHAAFFAVDDGRGGRGGRREEGERPQPEWRIADARERARRRRRLMQ